MGSQTVSSKSLTWFSVESNLKPPCQLASINDCRDGTKEGDMRTCPIFSESWAGSIV